MAGELQEATWSEPIPPTYVNNGEICFTSTMIHLGVFEFQTKFSCYIALFKLITLPSFLRSFIPSFLHSFLPSCIFQQHTVGKSFAAGYIVALSLYKMEQFAAQWSRNLKPHGRRKIPLMFEHDYR